MNRDELFSDAYYKYLGNEMRKAFGYEGCPILLVPKARPKTVSPIRKYNDRDGKPGAKPGAKPGERSRRPADKGKRPNKDDDRPVKGGKRNFSGAKSKLITKGNKARFTKRPIRRDLRGKGRKKHSP